MSSKLAPSGISAAFAPVVKNGIGKIRIMNITGAIKRFFIENIFTIFDFYLLVYFNRIRIINYIIDMENKGPLYILKRPLLFIIYSVNHIIGTYPPG
jgi:hypothetical protein